ncbi:MAG: asparaginase [Spirochaetes bacterium]|nr:asparaginase [Spirochaetota bacterium]
MRRKKILLLSTGGTIASEKTPGGTSPALGGTDLLRYVPDIDRFGSVESSEIMRVDSSNMQPEDWQAIARAAFFGLERHDGVVISHGTHTMAYTASALTFMLPGLKKPVVLTGAQIPAGEKGSDAVRNLENSLLFAGENAPGVFIVFGTRVIKGCRASKTSTVSFDAFESINYPPAASLKNGKIVHHLPPAVPQAACELKTGVDPSVFVLKLVPGLDPSMLETIGEAGYRAVVIECFGAGGVPFLGRGFVEAVRSLVSGGTIVAVSTQCVHGGVDLSIYDVGKKSLEAGVFSGLDMTAETLVTKLMWALGQSEDRDEVLKIMEKNYADEFTPGYKIRVR